MLTHATFYQSSNPRLIAFPPHVGLRGDVWGVEFIRSGYTARLVQDWPKRSGKGGNGCDIPKRTFARGYGRGYIRAGRCEVRYWLVRRVHGRRRRAGR